LSISLRKSLLPTINIDVFVIPLLSRCTWYSIRDLHPNFFSLVCFWSVQIV
jgi:hypothetical protein